MDDGCLPLVQCTMYVILVYIFKFMTTNNISEAWPLNDKNMTKMIIQLFLTAQFLIHYIADNITPNVRAWF